ncbi:hypothetical protein CALVIDRAFT_389841 [Calocera viscosa TUFC12733]|uniref:Uncharacterized protein n=1 Tax=Calocera viscosa (strain TUFC12733) TaxID=1330018 RepID=A0A167GHX6_CALVF|nr:hypothetical protein CALVIDRAFT_389841 [Calocera viscosa TUFC12733]
MQALQPMPLTRTTMLRTPLRRSLSSPLPSPRYPSRPIESCRRFSASVCLRTFLACITTAPVYAMIRQTMVMVITTTRALQPRLMSSPAAAGLPSQGHSHSLMFPMMKRSSCHPAGLLCLNGRCRQYPLWSVHRAWRRGPQAIRRESLPSLCLLPGWAELIPALLVRAVLVRLVANLNRLQQEQRVGEHNGIHHRAAYIQAASSPSKAPVDTHNPFSIRPADPTPGRVPHTALVNLACDHTLGRASIRHVQPTAALRPVRHLLFPPRELTDRCCHMNLLPSRSASHDYGYCILDLLH